jgi:hypothetical protein
MVQPLADADEQLAARLQLLLGLFFALLKHFYVE